MTMGGSEGRRSLIPGPVRKTDSVNPEMNLLNGSRTKVNIFAVVELRKSLRCRVCRISCSDSYLKRVYVRQESLSKYVGVTVCLSLMDDCFR